MSLSRKTSIFSLIVVALATLSSVFLSCAGTPPSRSEVPIAKAPIEAAPPAAPKPVEKVPERPPTKDEILAGAAKLLFSGDIAGALVLLDKIAPTVASDPGVALLKASILNSAGKTDQARAIAQEAVKLDPKNAEALYVLATVEGNAGKEKEQKDILEKAIAADPRHAPALAALGNLALRTKATKFAENYFDRSLAGDPKNREALIGKARARRRMDDPKNAEAALIDAMKAYPDWATPRVERARLYREAGFPANALTDLDEAKRLDPNDYWIAIERGIILLDLLKKTEALLEFDRAAAIEPNHFLSYAYSSGLRDDLGEWEAAERDYAKLAALKSDYFYAFEALGVLRIRDGRWAQAGEAFVEAFKRAPNRAHYALLVSLSWMRSGKMKDVRPFLSKVLPAVKRDTIEYYILRLYHDQSGDTDIAVRIDAEQNRDKRARMLYYLAQYYAARGNDTLAQRFHLQVRELDRRGIIEWRLNEWALEAYKIKG
ncbi:MAG: tetratricopeptide repeat protein [Treponemataceae bacterium]